MVDVPDSAIHWLLGLLAVSIGSLFLFLLRRTFNDFEVKIADLFSKLEKSIEQAAGHNTQIQLLAQRVTVLEPRVTNLEKRRR